MPLGKDRKRREVERLMDELVVAVPVAIRRAGLKPNACILASRLGSTALQARGVRARPLAVKLAVYNAPAAALLRANAEPSEQWADAGGRVVVLGHGSERPGWDGHLVLIVEERYLLDLTAAQVRRLDEGAKRAIEAEAFWIEAREIARGEALTLSGDDGALWIYEPEPENRSFLLQPAWSGFRVSVRGDQVISERVALVPGGHFAPEVRVRLRG